MILRDDFTEKSPAADSDPSQPRHSYPSIDGSQDPKAQGNENGSSGPRRRQRRAGTPPLVSGRKNKRQEAKIVGANENEAVEVVDPVRAALTWHEDEITVFDPEDSDDDGTGVNGVGFRPTPAMARLRMQKQKQQLLDYKKREESEARAKRLQRRRGNGGELPGLVNAKANETAVAARKVRFTEAEATAVAMTS